MLAVGKSEFLIRQQWLRGKPFALDRLGRAALVAIGPARMHSNTTRAFTPPAQSERDDANRRGGQAREPNHGAGLEAKTLAPQAPHVQSPGRAGIWSPERESLMPPCGEEETHTLTQTPPAGPVAGISAARRTPD